MSADHGSIVTVTGRIDPEDLGATLPHEHLFTDGSYRYEPPDSPVDQRKATQPISLETLWWVRNNAMRHRGNLRLDSVSEAIEEVTRFRDAGGDAIVDVTPKNYGNDPERVRHVSRETGVRIIQGTAFYNEENSVLPDRLETASIDDIADEFVSDVREGIDNTDVRAGIIGEIALSGDIYDIEEKVLRSGARAAVRTGAPVSVHPARDPANPYTHEILDICEEEGLDAERVILCHRDRSSWYTDLDDQREVAERGAFVEYDLFGDEHLHYRESTGDVSPTDVERVERLAQLIEDGYGSKLLISQDVFLKIHRVAYGGPGYGHILENVLPIFHELGADDDQIHELLVDNPRRILTFQ